LKFKGSRILGLTEETAHIRLSLVDVKRFCGDKCQNTQAYLEVFATLCITFLPDVQMGIKLVNKYDFNFYNSDSE
jgi:hypothetical protein